MNYWEENGEIWRGGADTAERLYGYQAEEARGLMASGQLGTIAGTAGRIIAGAAGSILGSLLGSNGPATEEQTPVAGLITGSCPPGLVRRRVAWGRDICTKRRRMNPLNPDALRRSTRRLVGFQKAVKSTQKALSKACGPRPARASGRCSTCKKRNCSC